MRNNFIKFFLVLISILAFLNNAVADEFVCEGEALGFERLGDTSRHLSVTGPAYLGIIVSEDSDGLSVRHILGVGGAYGRRLEFKDILLEETSSGRYEYESGPHKIIFSWSGSSRAKILMSETNPLNDVKITEFAVGFPVGSRTWPTLRCQ